MLDVCLECEVLLDTSDAIEGSDATSLSDCTELSSKHSSGTGTTWKLCELCEGFVTSGRIKDHGGDSLIKSMSSGSEDCISHSSNFFATQGFCVHRSLEKYALQACVLDNGCP